MQNLLLRHLAPILLLAPLTAQEGSEAHLVIQHIGIPSALDLDPTGHWLAAAGGTTLHVISLAHRAVVHTVDIGGVVTAPKWLDGGARLAFEVVGHVVVYDWRSGEVESQHRVRARRPSAARILANGDVVEIVEDDVVELRVNGRPLLKDLPQSAGALAVDPDESLALVLCEDPEEALLISLEDGSVLRRVDLSSDEWSLPSFGAPVDVHLASSAHAFAWTCERNSAPSLAVCALGDEASPHWVTVPEGLEVGGMLGFAPDGSSLYADVGKPRPLRVRLSDGAVLDEFDVGADADRVVFHDYEEGLNAFAVAAGAGLYRWRLADGDHADGVLSRARGIFDARAGRELGEVLLRVGEQASLKLATAILDLEECALDWSSPEQPARIEPSLFASFNGEGNVLTRDTQGVPVTRLDVPAAEFSRLTGTWTDTQGPVRLCVRESRVVGVETDGGTLAFDGTLHAAPIAGHWLPRERRVLFTFADGALELWTAKGRRARWDAVLDESTVRTWRGSASNDAVTELDDGRIWLATGAEWIVLDSEQAVPARRPMQLGSVRGYDGGRLLAWGYGQPVLVAHGDPITAELSEEDLLHGAALSFGWSPFSLPGTDLVITPGPIGSLTVWRAGVQEPVARVYVSTSGGLLLLGHDDRYLASPQALELLVEVDEAGKVRFPRSFDAARNDPGVMLERLGLSSRELISQVRQRSERRRARHEEGESGPELAFVSPPPLSHPIETPLFVALETEDGVVEIELAVNGVPIRQPPGKPIDLTAVEVPLRFGSNRISIVAVDGDGGRGTPLTVVIEGRGAERSPKVIHLGVGVAEYPRPALRLMHAVRDVEALQAALRRIHGARLDSVLLCDSEATRAAVLAQRAHLERAGFDDLVVLHLAGHGVLAADGAFSFLTVDGTPEAPEAALTIADLEDLLDGLGAGRVLVLIDACHSGAAGETPAEVVMVDRVPGARTGLGSGSPRESTSVDLRWTFADLGLGTGATILGASSAQQFAIESDAVAHGVFTHAVLEALTSGDAAGRDGVLRVSQLLDDVRRRVSAFTDGRQVPEIRSAPFGFDLEVSSSWPTRPLHVLPANWSARSGDLSSDGRFLALHGENAVRVVDLGDGTHRDWPLPDEYRSGAARPPIAALPAGEVLLWPANGDAGHLWLGRTDGSWDRGPALDATAVALLGEGRYALCWSNEDGRLVRLSDLEVVDTTPGFAQVTADRLREDAIAILGGIDRQTAALTVVDDALVMGDAVDLEQWETPGRADGYAMVRRLTESGRFVAETRSFSGDRPGWDVAVFDPRSGAKLHQLQVQDASFLVLLTPDGPLGLDSIASGTVGRVVSLDGSVVGSTAANVFSSSFLLSDVVRAGRSVAIARSLELATFSLDMRRRFGAYDPHSGRRDGWFDLLRGAGLLLGGTERLIYVAQGEVLDVKVPVGLR